MKKLFFLLLICFGAFSNELDDLIVRGMDFEFYFDYLNVPNDFKNNLDLIFNIKENDSKISPFFRLGTDYSKMFLFGSGLAYDFRQFFSKAFYEIRIPFIFNSKNIEHIGNLEFGYNFNYLRLESRFRSGLINHLIKETEDSVGRSYYNTLTLENTIAILLPVYYSEFQRADIRASFLYQYLLDNNEQFYRVHWNLKYLVSISFGELGFKADLGMAGAFRKFTIFETGFDYNALNFYALTIPKVDQDSIYFNFISNFGLEYRLFFLEALKNVASDLFLVLSSDIGYGMKEEYYLDKGKFLYIVGFGMGYKLFKDVPFVFKVGINQDKKLLFGFLLSSIIFE
ncbi:hypothetical protein baBA2_000883 (plasmid) [Borrelia anserina]|uniref:Uncharacterized protein n=2 Tax=Borrelia anserina TaxID=143 RepID=W5SQW5_BORAN|nr:hypothetical protein [Borrelia anserina]AHH09033.1 Hypothetical protein BAN_0900034 [Borrelia anserina BA2]APR65429.1 putative lipoprotein [Borrelia anserina Es]UPA07258.1 hypothetical protein baBA2_000883 [Borrelia anserina]